MIEVEHLYKSYGGHFAISDVSFRVNKGEILGFLGPNGAGKSTTMKILTTFIPPTRGTAKIDGIDILENPFEIKKRIGFLPENPPIYSELTVKEYLTFVAKLRGIEKSQMQSRIDDVIQKCDLSSFHKRLLGNLSKGMKQRVSLAQAIIHRPAFLILDEPTVGLDPRQVIEFRSLIKGFAGEHTVILSTHILSEVEALCSRIVVINKGQILTSESYDSMVHNVGEDRTEIAVKRWDDGIINALKAIPGILHVEKKTTTQGQRVIINGKYGDDGRAEIARMAVEKGWGLTRLTPTKTNLEEIYLRLITEGSHAVETETTQKEGHA